MDKSGACRGVMAICLADGTFHRFKSKYTVLATGGYGRVYQTTTCAFTVTGDGNAMVTRAGLPLKDMEFLQFHPTGLYGAGILISEACRGEGGFLRNSKGERFMEKYAPTVKDLASRDVVSRSIILEILEGRGCGPKKDYVYLHLDHIPKEKLYEKLPGMIHHAKIFANRDLTKEGVPITPTMHYTMGGIDTNLKTEVMTKIDGKDVVVPGLLAAGEAACVNVHGANRLGANSLLDIMIFGKEAALTIAENMTPYEKQPDLPKDAGYDIIEKVDKIKYSTGKYTVDEIRTIM